MDGSAKEESVDSLELRPRAQPIPLPLAFGTRGGQPILLVPKPVLDLDAESEPDQLNDLNDSLEKISMCSHCDLSFFIEYFLCRSLVITMSGGILISLSGSPKITGFKIWQVD